MRIVVTDSSLGGIAATAHVTERLARSGIAAEAEVIFVNAMYDYGKGFNYLKDRKKKVALFKNVLEAIEERFAPDEIVVACNTLSALYETEEHLRSIASCPVHSIVPAGVRLLVKALESDVEACVYLFATTTTVSENVYSDHLAQQGVDVSRLVQQECPGLAWAMEQHPHDQKARDLIEKLFAAARTQNGYSDSPFFISLNCTHYPYGLPFWQDLAESRGGLLRGILDPSRELIDSLPLFQASRLYDETNVAVSAYSRHALNERSVANVSALVEDESSPVADALRNYHHVEDFYRWAD